MKSVCHSVPCALFVFFGCARSHTRETVVRLDASNNTDAFTMDSTRVHDAAQDAAFASCPDDPPSDGSGCSTQTEARCAYTNACGQWSCVCDRSRWTCTTNSCIADQICPTDRASAVGRACREGLICPGRSPCDFAIECQHGRWRELPCADHATFACGTNSCPVTDYCYRDCNDVLDCVPLQGSLYENGCPSPATNECWLDEAGNTTVGEECG